MTEPTKPERAAAEDAKISRMELWISSTLRIGVSASIVLVLVGLIVSFVHHPNFAFSAAELKELTTPGAAFPTTLAAVAKGIAAFHGRAIVMAGLLLLIVTPVMRVAISVLVFAEERDWTFMLLTTVVLAILLLSFVLGRVEGG